MNWIITKYDSLGWIKQYVFSGTEKEIAEKILCLVKDEVKNHGEPISCTCTADEIEYEYYEHSYLVAELTYENDFRIFVVARELDSIEKIKS